MEGIRGSLEVAEDGEHGVGGLAGMKKLGMHATELCMKLAFAYLIQWKSSAVFPQKADGKANPCQKQLHLGKDSHHTIIEIHRIMLGICEGSEHQNGSIS